MITRTLDIHRALPSDDIRHYLRYTYNNTEYRQQYAESRLLHPADLQITWLSAEYVTQVS